MRPFGYRKISSESEAIGAATDGGRYLAGGTTLVDLMREEVEQPSQLIDINALPLRDIRAEGDTLVIGALARMADVAAHPDTRRLQPLIAEALVEGASPQLRNMASIGGNLLQRVRCPYFRMRDAACNKRNPGSGCAAIGGIDAGLAILGTSSQCAATHPSDLAVALVATEATMTVHGPEGHRSFPVEELFRLPADTPHLEHTLQPGELIVEVRVPTERHSLHGRYLKIRDRASYEFALVAIAAALHVEDDLIRAVRLAAGGVGTRPWRLRSVEEALIGKPARRDAFVAAAELALEGAKPLSGNRYKLELLTRTLVRALEMSREAR